MNIPVSPTGSHPGTLSLTQFNSGSQDFEWAETASLRSALESDIISICSNRSDMPKYCIALYDYKVGSYIILTSFVQHYFLHRIDGRYSEVICRFIHYLFVVLGLGLAGVRVWIRSNKSADSNLWIT